MSFKNTLWVEKYRPSTIDDCILPKEMKIIFKKFVETHDIPNMIFTGKPGIGKTTVAKALCSEMNCDYMVINGSDESGIDVLRTKIKSFASTVSLSGGKKIVIIDEADYLNPQSTQPAMRNFMEEFSANCRFILTCNFKMKIIEPLISRCNVFEFSISSAEKKNICLTLLKRLTYILTEENIECNDQKILADIIIKFFPDFRKTISELQRYSIQNGKIDVGILSNLQEISIKELMRYLKEKDFKKMRQWVNESLENHPTHIIRCIFDSLNDYMEPASIPTAILILGDYSYKSSFVADHELNLTAMLINLMHECLYIK